MKLTVLAVALAVAGGVTAGTAGIERIAWLQGCWELASTELTVEEQWMAPRGGSMIGVSRTVRGGSTLEYELAVIRERGDRLVYIAHPSGQPTAEFTEAAISEGRIVFENLEHDFPQRIGYERQGAALEAYIEGTKAGQQRRIAFPYRRTTCPGD
jgi:Domain of unknown function (DUF6265)